MWKLAGTLLAWLSLAVGTLSLLRLFETGLGISFVDPVTQLLAAYDGLLQTLVDIELPWWSESLVNLIVAGLRDLLGWKIALESHWKHVFVLMWLYFSADLKGAILWRRPGLAAFEFAWGAVVALFASVGAGSSAVGSTDFNVVVAIAPVLGVALYGVGDGAWRAIFYRDQGYSFMAKVGANIQRPLWFALTGIVACALWSWAHSMGWFERVPAPSLLFVLVMTVLLAVYWIAKGAVRSAQAAGGAPDWFSQARQSGSVLLGLRMLSTLGTAGLVVVANAFARSNGL